MLNAPICLPWNGGATTCGGASIHCGTKAQCEDDGGRCRFDQYISNNRSGKVIKSNRMQLIAKNKIRRSHRLPLTSQAKWGIFA